jgi:SAM-dependent methyltransferase
MAGRRLGRAARLAGVALAAGTTLLVMRRCRTLGLAGGRASLSEGWARLRTSSSPSVCLYEVVWGSLLGAFHDLVAAEAAAALPMTGEPTVLEVGPGPGFVMTRLLRRAPEARFIALDIDQAMLDRCARRASEAVVTDRVTLIRGDVASLPLGDASVDLVVSSFSVHHWADPARGFAEIRRVLRPGGRALIYDLPDIWGRIETGAPGLASAAVGGGFDPGTRSRVRWPGSIRVIERLGLSRPVG